MMRAMYHPLAFTADLPRPGGAPLALRIAKTPVVVWRPQQQQPWSVFLDRCPHRGAKLSHGTVEEGGLVCGYHGWTLAAGSGRCVRIPQWEAGAGGKEPKIPRACDATVVPSFVHDGMLWVRVGGGGEDPPESEQAARQRLPPQTWVDPAPAEDGPRACFVTDYALEAPYGYGIQMENLLDPAHIHFVHDGFQGNRKKAGVIVAKRVRVGGGDDGGELSALFEHVGPEAGVASQVPQIHIRARLPSVVDVSVLNDRGQVTRKNIVYVAPVEEGRCRVLFRDVTFKAHLLPGQGAGGAVGRRLLARFEEPYDAVNRAVIREIMEQDVRVLRGQQENLEELGERAPVLPTASDVLIRAFRGRAGRG
jgi:phenylpropionate dioxygenase-like ring-hydroxylating dioxygenase large terminal subunit